MSAPRRSNVELQVTVFQRKRGRNLEWFTVGLGQYNTSERAPSAAKVQQRLVDALRKRVGVRWPLELEPIEFVRGRRLEFVDIALSLPDPGGGRRRIHGTAPIVLEPRTRGPGLHAHPLWVAYHPLRPHEWFVHEPGPVADKPRELAAEVAVFVKERWASLEDDAIENLWATVGKSKPGSQGKRRPTDRLKLIALRLPVKGLVEHLEKDKEDDSKALIGQRKKRTSDGVLAEIGVNQTLRALDGKLSPGAPRAPFRGQLAQLVCGRRKTSVLLVGPSGVGKSVLLARLVHDLLAADDYPSHRNLDRVHSVWQVRGRRIIAGMSYLGQWEQRCVDILETAQDRRALLWVDDVHAWGRIGESRESDRSLATFFRGPLARRELTMLGECTPQQLQQLRDDCPAFASAFTPLHITPTSESETMRLIVHEARALEQRFSIAFDPRTFRTVYELGSSLGSGSAHPGRSLDLLRALASGEHGFSADMGAIEAEVRKGRKIAAIKLYRSATRQGLRESKDAVETYMRTGHWAHVNLVAGRPVIALRSVYSTPIGTSRSQGPPEITPDTVIRMLAKRTGMPEVLLATRRSLPRSALIKRFMDQIVGQRKAVQAVTELTLRIKSGLVDPGRPYGVFLFTGPTGTGKTEMAKCVAEYLYGDKSRLLRFDMSEYNGPDAAARLIGDRWRPVGALTGQVRAQPFSVVLLDEVEKAAPQVLNLMLQLFDDGRLTDASGALVDFTHTVVIMTSNLGARATPSVGFGTAREEEDTARDLVRDVAAAVREFFPPELFNRIDHVVRFDPLTRDAAAGIARRELARVLDRRGLSERNVFVHITPTVVDRVVRDGFNQRDGARSLKRYLEEHIGGRLSDEIAANEAAGVRVYWLYVKDGALRIHGERLREAAARGMDPTLEELLGWGMGRLRGVLPDSLERLDRMLAGPELERLGDALSASLERFRLGGGDRTEAGDAVFNLDALRGQLTAVRERLATQVEYDPHLQDAASVDVQIDNTGELLELARYPTVPKTIAMRRWRGYVTHLRSLDPRAMSPALPMKSRPAILDHLAELFFLERALDHAEDADQHAVLIELTRISRSRGPNRFAAHEMGLLEDIALAMIKYGRGELDGVAVVDREELSPRPHSPALTTAYHQVALRLIGPAVRAFYDGEHGCHVRHSVQGTSEVVRLRVLPGRALTPYMHLQGIKEQREAFLRALEQREDGEALPPNPDAVLPIVRRYHYDRPKRASALTKIVVEDYPLAHATEMRASSLGDVLRVLWMLRLGTTIGRRGDAENPDPEGR